jgi:chaperonin GroEL
VLALLIVNKQAGKLPTLAVRAMEYLSNKRDLLEDVVALVGGRAIAGEAGEDLRNVQLADLGAARRVWATAHRFGVIGGKSDPHQLRAHIARLRSQLSQAEDGHDRDRLRQRLSKLLGGMAILRVGAATEAELNARKAVAGRASVALRVALQGGIVPGGGRALLDCQPALGEGFARRILSRALEEPLRVIAANAGFDPGSVVAEVRASAPGYGFDARTGRIVNLREAGIVDAALVLQTVVRTAVSGAALALTTDVLIHHRNPERCTTP